MRTTAKIMGHRRPRGRRRKRTTMASKRPPWRFYGTKVGELAGPSSQGSSRPVVPASSPALLGNIPTAKSNRESRDDRIVYIPECYFDIRVKSFHLGRRNKTAKRLTSSGAYQNYPSRMRRSRSVRIVMSSNEINMPCHSTFITPAPLKSSSV